MDNILQTIFNNAQASESKDFVDSLLDLKFLIERFVQNRYNDKDEIIYAQLYSNKSLLNYKLTHESISTVKYFLFFLLLNFPDRASFTASCIKSLLDESIREAIIAAIQLYMEIDDETTSELMFAISNLGDMKNYFSDKKIFDLFEEIPKKGGTHSKEIADSQFIFYKKYYQK